jgi:hypothetical protein
MFANTLYTLLVSFCGIFMCHFAATMSVKSKLPQLVSNRKHKFEHEKQVTTVLDANEFMFDNQVSKCIASINASIFVNISF